MAMKVTVKIILEDVGMGQEEIELNCNSERSFTESQHFLSIF